MHNINPYYANIINALHGSTKTWKFSFILAYYFIWQYFGQAIEHLIIEVKVFISSSKAYQEALQKLQSLMYNI